MDLAAADLISGEAVVLAEQTFRVNARTNAQNADRAIGCLRKHFVDEGCKLDFIHGAVLDGQNATFRARGEAAVAEIPDEHTVAPTLIVDIVRIQGAGSVRYRTN